MEQYKAQNVTYERDIPIVQETVGGTWKKEEELKALKAEVAALERKIQLTLTPPKPEAGQELPNDEKVQSASFQNNRSGSVDAQKDAEQFIHDHIIVARPPTCENRIGKSPKL